MKRWVAISAVLMLLPAVAVAQESKAEPFAKGAIYSYMAAAAIDSIQTAHCLAYPTCKEGNPFVAYFTDRWGPVTALSVGTALSTALGAYALHNVKRAPKRWLVVAAAMTALHVKVIIHNAKTIRDVKADQ